MRYGVWFRQGKIYLNSSSSLIPIILADCHSTPIGGHFGYNKTLGRLKATYCWSGMHKALKEFLRHYETCQCYKTDSMAPTSLLQPLPVPNRIWTEISMDFFEGLPSSHGNSVIMVVVNRLSKYGHFMALKHPFSAITMAQAFIDHVVLLHRNPVSIVSDRDKVFLSTFWRTLFQLHGTALRMSSSYHPQMDGQMEVMNQVLFYRGATTPIG